MPILDTQFTCSNGHTFTANAKSRSRCPECNELVKKIFTPSSERKPTVPISSKPPIKEPILVRAGKPRTVKKKPAIARVNPVTVKPTLRHVSGGNVKVHRAVGKVAASVKRPPNKTNVTKQAHAAAEQSGARNESYASKIMRQFGIGK